MLLVKFSFFLILCKLVSKGISTILQAIFNSTYINKRIVELELPYDIYETAFYNAFDSVSSLYQDPIFLNFLPFILFFEFAKCEGYIPIDSRKKKTDSKETTNSDDTINSVFTFVQTQDKTSGWNVRYSPLKIDDERKLENIKKAISLYDQIKNSVLATLLNLNYHSIGQELYRSLFQLTSEAEDKCNVFYISDRYLTVPPIDIPIDLIDRNVVKQYAGVITREQSFFYLPVPNIEYIASRLAECFELNEKQSEKLHSELKTLYSRFLKKQNAKDSNKIEKTLDEYKYFTCTYQNNDYNLSKVLEYICILFNPWEFSKDVDVFKQARIKEYIDYLTGFGGDNLDFKFNKILEDDELSEVEVETKIKYYPELENAGQKEEYKDPTSRSWRDILSECCYIDQSRSEDINYFDPNDALVRALFSSHLDFIQQNKENLEICNLKSTAFNYGTTRTYYFQEEIEKALTAYERLHHTAVEWSGVNLRFYKEESGNNELFPKRIYALWGYQCPEKRIWNMKIIEFLYKHPKELNKLLKSFKPVQKSNELIFKYYNDGMKIDFNAPLTGIHLKRNKHQIDSQKSLGKEIQRLVKKFRSELERRKKTLINILGEIGAPFSQGYLSDFHYYFLIYQIISLINEEMCREISKLVDNISPKI